MNKRQKLQLMGYIPTENGDVVLSGLAAKVFSGWERYIVQLFENRFDLVMKSPLSIPERYLEQSEYINNFPQHLIIAKPIQTSRSSFYLTPASCLHVYPSLHNQRIDKKSILISGLCSRAEAGKLKFPFRLRHFHMAEVVLIGPESQVERTLASNQKQITQQLSRDGFLVRSQQATDPFFSSQRRGAKIFQKLQGLKQELYYQAGHERIALISFNNHQDFFTSRFKLHNKNSERLTSACIAFGLERLCAASLLRWGANDKKWPRSWR